MTEHTGLDATRHIVVNRRSDKTMKMYDLSEQYRTLQILMDQGDLGQEELAGRLAQIEDTIGARVESLASLIREYELQAGAIKEEVARLTARAKSFEANAARLREWLQDYLENTGLTKPIKGTRFTVSLRPCPPSVRVLDERAIPEEFWRVIPETREINKRAIIDLYREGGEIVDGTDIITDRKTLNIR